MPNNTLTFMFSDIFLAVFDNAGDAALLAQQGLTNAHWEDPIGSLRVRLGLHSGTAEARDGDYFGPEVNQTGPEFAGGAAFADLVRVADPDAIPLGNGKGR